MDVKWILAAFLPLLTEMLSTEKAPLSGLGTNQSSAVAYTSPRFQYGKNATFNLGSDVNLTCSNRTWNTTMFVVWNINLTNPPKVCRIAVDFVRPLVDTCRDGKSLHNTSRGQLYLHIPNLSNDDVGIYKCESVYKGGNEVHMINMDITVPPSLSAWLESEGEKMVAVCRAERAKPAANISWSQAGSIVETLLEDGGFFSVESRLELLEGADTENLTCVIDHPYWREQQILQPALKRVRNATFNLGSDVNLTCSNRTWSRTMFVVWNINLTNPPKRCRIAFEFGGPLVDTCRDGKSLHNTSRGQSYLHIPNLSNDDVGIYRCELVYIGGNEVHEINMDITVPPSLSAWLESEGEKMVAVCRAERAKPAANISWSQAGSIVETLLEDGGFFSVESRLELLEGADTENLTCVIDHPYWREQQILQPALKRGYTSLLLRIIISVVAFLVMTALSFRLKNE
ncbi:nectin-3-like protein isoform X2 [Takifugu flavidus]|uniref:nectin-3-like protein isoform X2 n=1 Tax=Takifugu flavidus TaxID=433684 RepID=UPI002544894E|nr:nectin-3-like protein isoform X2 [Takifugu flavidus]